MTSLRKRVSSLSSLATKGGLKGFLPLSGLSLIRVAPALLSLRRNLLLQGPQHDLSISRPCHFEEGIQSLLQKEAFEEVLDTSSHVFYFGMFLVSKNIRDWHPIIEMSVLNTYLKFQTFRMESADSI